MRPVALEFDLLPTSEVRPKGGYSLRAMAFLNLLRFVSMECRVKPRMDLFEACALLKAERSASCHGYAEALMRCLGEALGKAPRLYAPGTGELTFDERWLLQLGLAFAHKDTDSQRFLLNSRLSFENRRLVGFLMHQIAGFVDID